MVRRRENPNAERIAFFDKLNAIFGEELERFRVGDEFGVEENAVAQRVDGVVIVNRDGLLQNDRAVIVFVVDEVNGRAADLDAATERRVVNASTVVVFAAERRNQRRVNVQNAVREVGRNREELQIAAHRDVFDFRFATSVENGVAKLFFRHKFRAFDDSHRDTVLLGVLQPGRALRTGNDEANVDVEFARFDAVEQIFQGAARSGNQDRDRKFFSHKNALLGKNNNGC